MKIKRFGVSLEKELLDALDNLVRRHRFPNRSQAIRFLIRKNLAEEEPSEDKTAYGALFLIYEHHRRQFLDRSLDIQHSYNKLIISSQHVHLDEYNCLEIIVLKGKTNTLRGFSDRMIALKGTKYGKFLLCAQAIIDKSSKGAKDKNKKEGR